MPDDSREDARDARLGELARGALGEDERRALYEAALDDQALFDALAAEDGLQDVLADASARETVKARLRGAPPKASVPRWSAPLAAAASVAVVALGAFFLYGGRPDLVRVAGPPTAETERLWREAESTTEAKGLAPFELRVNVASGALGSGRFQRGEELHITLLSVGRDADAALLLQLPDGALRPLDPPAEAITRRLAADTPREVRTADGRPPVAPRVLGLHRLRLVALEGGQALGLCGRLGLAPEPLRFRRGRTGHADEVGTAPVEEERSQRNGRHGGGGGERRSPARHAGLSGHGPEPRLDHLPRRGVGQDVLQTVFRDQGVEERLIVEGGFIQRPAAVFLQRAAGQLSEPRVPRVLPAVVRHRPPLPIRAKAPRGAACDSGCPTYRRC